MGNERMNQNQDRSLVGMSRPNVPVQPAAGQVPESLIGILWRNRLIIIATTTSKIYVEQTGPKIISETEEGIMTQSTNYLYNQAELLTSTPILSAVVNAPGITEMSTFAGVRNPVNYLKGTLDVRVGQKDDIIRISFDSPSPTEAAQIVNAVVESYIAYHGTRKRSTSAEVLKILQTEKTRRSEELSEKLRAMMDFKKSNPTLAFEGPEGNVILQRFQRLSSVLTEAQLETVDSRSLYESTKEIVSDPNKREQFVEAQLVEGGYDTTSNERAELKSRLEQLQLRRADRLREVTIDHPGVIVLEGEIARLKAQISELDTKFARTRLAMVEEQYLAAQAKEDQITRTFEDQRQEALSLNEQLAQYTILQSDWEQTKQLCDILNERIKEVNVTEDVGALNISVLEAARPAEGPSKPEKPRYMAMALVLGLILGGALALVRDWMDVTLRSPEEVSAVLGVPVVGVIPSMYRERNGAARGLKVHLDPDSPAAEACRKVRTALFLGVANAKAKTILVTSPARAEGKTTLVSNLAISMAQAGQRTLIVDADFRHPMQHLVFKTNGSDEQGLVSVLSGTMALEKAIEATDVKGLDLLPCRMQLMNASEVVNSRAFAQLLENLADKYDRVVIDSPPVVPVTDAQILSALCDVTLLVLRADKSTRKTALEARDGLLGVGAHLLGAVVNHASKKSRYGYYTGYAYNRSFFGNGRKKKTAGGKATAVIED
jgi:capsular exopolysaccharide synthesis family protein